MSMHRNDEDITYNPGISIYDEGVIATSPCHLPAEDMAGMEQPDPIKRKRSLLRIDMLRSELGIRTKRKREAKPLHYVCSQYGCSERRFRGKQKPEPKRENVDATWLRKLRVKANSLPDRAVNQESNEAA